MNDMTSVGSDRRNRSREALFESRRRYPRVRAAVDLFYESGTRVAVAEALDLSLRGTFFRTRLPDPVGTRASLRIALSDLDKMIRVDVEVVRTSLDGMGLAFRSMGDDDRALLAAFLLRHIGLAALPQLDRHFGGTVRNPKA